MTANSVDAVIIQEHTTSSFYPRSQSRDSNVLSLSEFDIISDVGKDRASTPDFFPRLESSQNTQDDGQEFPVSDSFLEIPSTPASPRSPGFDQDAFECPPSPRSSIVSSAFTMGSISSICEGSLTIKAAHNSSIIMLRVPRNTSFDDIRLRLYNKFVGQEGIPLSQEFAVAMVVPSTSLEEDKCSQQSQCMPVTFSDRTELHFIDTQYDWEQVVLIRDSNKVTLKIFDAPNP